MPAVHRVKGISLKVAVLAGVMAAMILGGAVSVAIDLASGSGAEETVPETVVFGDSVTRLAAEEIAAETGAEVVAYNGAKWADLGPAVGPALADRGGTPKRVAVLLGTNDVIDLTMASVDFAAVLDGLAGVPCVVVLELPKTVGGLARGVNAALRAEVAQRPNVVSDNEWSILANRNLEQHGATWFGEDKIHPNDTGQRRLAESYASALDRHCGPSAG